MSLKEGLGHTTVLAILPGLFGESREGGREGEEEGKGGKGREGERERKGSMTIPGLFAFPNCVSYVVSDDGLNMVIWVYGDLD